MLARPWPAPSPPSAPRFAHPLQLPLVDALCGGRFTLRALDGRQLVLSLEGRVVRHDSWMRAEVSLEGLGWGN